MSQPPLRSGELGITSLMLFLSCPGTLLPAVNGHIGIIRDYVADHLGQLVFPTCSGRRLFTWVPSRLLTRPPRLHCNAVMDAEAAISNYVKVFLGEASTSRCSGSDSGLHSGVLSTMTRTPPAWVSGRIMCRDHLASCIQRHHVAQPLARHRFPIDPITGARAKDGERLQSIGALACAAASPFSERCQGT
ncbi:hypothetical protein LXA43DRAFT_1044012 [Ganoderma leucocontextum]|nr:hypothetical protein LXA43DRAFT_1044012 [Ganoderma leucocontextum]